MTVQLTPMELLAREIGILEEKRKSMDASIKASEARLKDIRSGYDLAAIEVKQDLDTLQIEQEQKMAELKEMVEPLKGHIEALQAQIDREQKNLEAIEAERQRVLDERRIQVAALDEAIQLRQASLQSVSDDILSLKHKVGAL